MIAVIQVERWKDKRFWEKVKLRFHRFAVAEETAQSPWGEYQVLRVCDRRVRWDQIERFVQRGVHFLVPKDLETPEGFPVFFAKSWEESFFHEAANRLLAQLNCPMNGRRIILADKDGTRRDWLEKWIFYSPVFELICEREDRCQALAKELLEEYGAILLHAKELPKHSRGLLLDPEGWQRPWKGFQGVIFTSVQERGKGICLEPSLSVFENWNPPEGILPQDFLAACLQEGWLSTAEIACQGRQNGMVFSWEELIRLSSESCQSR